MVQAIVNLGEREDRVLTIVKGKFGLKNKSEAINLVIGKFEQELLEPRLRPEYKDKLAKIISGKHLSRGEFEKEVA
ncbi:MAG: antitoxin [Nanoarchaeota archaeon]